MNKKNKTLLIALSIMIIALFISVFVINPITKENEKKVSSSSKAEIVEEVIEEKAAEKTAPKEEPVKLLSVEEIAKEVIAGKWGSGAERKAKLTEAGYNYEEVQAQVDKILPKPIPKTTTPKTSSSQPTTSSPVTPIPSGEYPEVRLIWNTMRSWGWSPETCAGIIGNMMAEVGGGTLNLSRWNTGGCGYGLIQWTSGRAALIKRRYGSQPNISQQLQFMKDEMFGTNNTRKQISDSALNTILNKSGTQTPESVALCFAANFERCGQAYRARRQGFARTAYNYFMQ